MTILALTVGKAMTDKRKTLDDAIGHMTRIAQMQRNRQISVTMAMLTLVGFYSDNASSAGELWVTTDRADRRTCPSVECGLAGQLMFREAATPLEKRGEWVRVTRPYSASCVNGNSEYVKSGPRACSRENGIVNGKFSEWVESKNLSQVRPPDPGAGATGDDKLVSGSDDYGTYRTQFTQAARTLIANGTCTEDDFNEMGGWMASTSQGKGKYFTYCGGMSVQNRIYLDVKTGKTGK